MSFEPLDQYLQRQKKLRELAALGHDPYPHRFDASVTVNDVLDRYASRTKESLEAEKIPVRLAGRLMTIRLQGKAGFAHIQSQGCRLQIYVKLDVVGQNAFELYRLLDMGDIIGVEGFLFRTKTD
ncbi:MAG: lysine--tRNA ligase, partial [Acidobacteria bacterium]|nr:lysine--tRNA ligase [Acidobacteriota bacterium]